MIHFLPDQVIMTVITLSLVNIIKGNEKMRKSQVLQVRIRERAKRVFLSARWRFFLDCLLTKGGKLETPSSLIFGVKISITSNLKRNRCKNGKFK